MIVVDAGVLVVALAEDGEPGHVARTRLRGERLAAPELIDLEVLSALRGLSRSGKVLPRRADLALVDLESLPMDRAPHNLLLRRCWELRDNLTPYDASYVALAEALDTTLLTGDRRLAGATGPRCRVELIRVSN
ncbi:MAG: type II toxin-antitoxin system VapC family toxin [Dermatophilaceae bacterium]